MKVNIYETIEISDEDRVRLGAILDGKAKPKRQATRDEIKQFVWSHGEGWDIELRARWRQEFDSAPDESEEDLLGSASASEEPDDEFSDLI